MRKFEMSLAAQTAYAELLEQTCALEVTNALSGLKGSFQRLIRKGKSYWYFAYRDLGGAVRMAYIGADDARVQALISRFSAVRRDRPLVPAARAAIALGCMPMPPKHFRIIKRLAEYGFFRAGGILVGSHAFLALGNMLGMQWRNSAAALDVDFAHAGRNISFALSASFKLDMLDAVESLERGLLPISQFNSATDPKYRNVSNPEPRIDFLTSKIKNKQPVALTELNLEPVPLKFMEFLLEQTTHACVFSNAGACVVNLPTPERFAVHKLVVYGERPVSEHTKLTKDLLQAANLIDYFVETGQVDAFNLAWRDALQRGNAWKARAVQGQAALLALAPTLGIVKLWA